MSVFRQSRHPLVRWWWEMDRMVVLLLLFLMLLGGIAVTTASIAVSKTYNVAPYYFAIRQYIFLGASLFAMIFMTFLKPKGTVRVGFLLFLIAIAGLVLTFVMGQDVKGASRWIYIMGISVQPSEFMKPALIIITAYLLGKGDNESRQRGFFISCFIMLLITVPLLKQPDVGMLLLLGMVWFAQVFLSGISMIWLAPLVLIGLGIVSGAYVAFDHVRSRLERFLNPVGADTYQVDQAREAILTGHLFGRGAGEGVVKHTLPDAHTDFIFAVVAEEFGIIMCLALLGIYVAVVLRGFYRLLSQEDRYVLLAAGGFLVLLSLQVMVNIGVALQLLPTTGMTLPFISYGGSATLSMGISMGFLLALLRKRRLRL